MGDVWAEGAVAWSAVRCIQSSVPVMSLWEIEYIAADLYWRAGSVDIEALTTAAGCLIRSESTLPLSADAWLLLPDPIIAVRPGCDRLIVLHQLSHWLLREREYSRE